MFLMFKIENRLGMHRSAIRWGQIIHTFYILFYRLSGEYLNFNLTVGKNIVDLVVVML